MISKLKAALAVFGALALAIVTAFWRGKAAGTASTTAKTKEADHARANDVRARADAARAAASDSPIAELRNAGRIRD